MRAQAQVCRRLQRSLQPGFLLFDHSVIVMFAKASGIKLTFLLLLVSVDLAGWDVAAAADANGDFSGSCGWVSSLSLEQPLRSVMGTGNNLH